MIYGLLMLDILLNNYSPWGTYFFIIYLYDKKYKDYLLTGIILDLIILRTGLLNTAILSIMYILNMLFDDLNKKNVYIYIYINMFNYLLFIILSNILLINSINKILLTIGNNIFINILFYILYFRVYINNNY